METRTDRPQVEARRTVALPPSLSVKQLAELLEISPVEAIKQLMRQKIMASVNHVIDFAAASAVARACGVAVTEKSAEAAAEAGKPSRPKAKGAHPRPPVITIMGHVDHGKTTLLDAIRQSNVAATEAGEITQHIGAYQVETNGKKLTFLDTPGHEAFTAMRARGARATDIAVLVVAADDGVMPQTVEALNHARAAGVPIVVAINKIDKAGADPERVKRQLSEQNLIVEDWGGDVIAVPVSAKAKKGIPELLEYLLLVAEMAELTADPKQPAQGVVLEAALDKNRGPVATVLVQNGTLEVGDVVAAGNCWGRIKAMFNDRGKKVRTAEPATPVEVLGLNAVTQPGDSFAVVATEREARSLVEGKPQARPGAALARVTLEALSSQISAGKVKELNIVLKTDVQGSIEPIKASVEQLSSERVKVRVIHAAPGTITESDVMLARASTGIVLGFSTRPEPGARRIAEAEGVEIRLYDVIYTLVEAVQKASLGLVEPIYSEMVEARGEIIATFPASGGLKRAAGVKVLQGKISLGAQIRIKRNNEVVADSRVKSLRRYKDNVSEVGEGMEAGIGIESFWNFQIGDVLECYRRERVA